MKTLPGLLITFTAIIAITGGCNKSASEVPTLAAVALALYGTQTDSSCTSDDYNWSQPSSWPKPAVPCDNLMSEQKVTLGRYLFYDKRLSGNEEQACASCHIQSLAFSDQRTTGMGSTLEAHSRSPQQLDNPAYNSAQTWSNNTLFTLEEQAKAPLYGTAPIELGMTDPESGTPEAIARLQDAIDVDYQYLFAEAFGGNGYDQINDENIRKAIASFERSFVSSNSYFDQYISSGGDTTVLSDAGLNPSYVIAGRGLFISESGDCFHCHDGFNFADTTFHSLSVDPELFYHSNGIYSDDEYAAMNDNQKGLYITTGLTNDTGRFRAPSLRNVALTYPYMHDGSFACSGYTEPLPSIDGSYSIPVYDETCAREALASVVAHYNSGGKDHYAKDTSLIRPLGLTSTEQAQIVEFLMSLTDADFRTNPSLSNPEYGNPNFVNHE